MQNLKIFIALIALIFAVVTTSKAQEDIAIGAIGNATGCFNMQIQTTHILGANPYTIATITINNYSGGTVFVTDGVNNRSCSGSCTFSWVYSYIPNKPITSADKYIECSSSGGCIQYDGCTILIDPR